MTKLFCHSMCLLAMVLAFSGVAHAVTYTDMVTGPVYLNVKDPTRYTYTFAHDITDEGFVPGTAGLDATVTLTFDDDHLRDEREYVLVSIGGTTYRLPEVNLMDVFALVVDSPGVTALQTEGRLTVQVQTTKGDLNFTSSALVAQTPEPSTLLLLGSGLAGVASLGFKRRKP